MSFIWELASRTEKSPFILFLQFFIDPVSWKFSIFPTSGSQCLSAYMWTCSMVTDMKGVLARGPVSLEASHNLLSLILTLWALPPWSRPQKTPSLIQLFKPMFLVVLFLLNSQQKEAEWRCSLLLPPSTEAFPGIGMASVRHEGGCAWDTMAAS